MSTGPVYEAPLYAHLVDAEVTGRVFAAAGGYLGEMAKPREKLLAYREGEPWTQAELAGLLS